MTGQFDRRGCHPRLSNAHIHQSSFTPDRQMSTMLIRHILREARVFHRDRSHESALAVEKDDEHPPA
jgi:hypothetical protein